MSNVYDTTHQLAKELREEESYAALKDSFVKVRDDQEANELYEKFRKIQTELQQKAAFGTEITEEDMTEVKAVQEEVQNNEILTAMMNDERRLSTVIEDINKIISEAISEIYQ